MRVKAFENNLAGKGGGGDYTNPALRLFLISRCLISLCSSRRTIVYVGWSDVGQAWSCTVFAVVLKAIRIFLKSRSLFCFSIIPNTELPSFCVLSDNFRSCNTAKQVLWLHDTGKQIIGDSPEQSLNKKRTEKARAGKMGPTSSPHPNPVFLCLVSLKNCPTTTTTN